MKKKLLITLIMTSLALTACGAKEKTETNESQQAQIETTENVSQQQREIQTETVVSEKDMLLEINNWIVGDVWNKGFCDFYHYEEDGTSSTGESIDIEFALSQFKENYKKKDEYNSYIHSLSNDFENIINIWDKLIKEADTLYAHYENGVEQTGTSADTAIFTQYRDAFSENVQNFDFSSDAKKEAESIIESGTEKESESIEVSEKTLEDIENYLLDKGLLSGERVRMGAELIGGIDGFKYKDSVGEIYEYDVNSEEYKKLANGEEIPLQGMEGFTIKAASVNGKFVLIGDDASQELINAFNSFQ